MKNLLISLGFAIILQAAGAQQTPFEESNGTKTATYFEAIAWYKSLSTISGKIKIEEKGPTDAGYPLHTVLISADKGFDPQAWHRQKKVVILINNGIHPGEPDGIDASMMLARDIIKNKITLPANVVLAIIPVYNIGGCLNRNSYTRVNQNGPESYGFRGNSQNLDLNRDFTKNDSREAGSFAKIFHWLNPEILIDNHVSDGADYQHTMTLISTQYEKLGPVLGKWLKEKFEPALYAGMAKKNWELIPYIDFDNTNFDKGMRMFYDPPRYSSGYAALFNTLSFMPETHMLKPYKQRVQSTYDLMLTFIEEASKEAAELIQKKAEADQVTSRQVNFPLRWVTDSSYSNTIVFKGYERDSALSEATGLIKMFYNHNRPYTRNIRYFNTYKAYSMVEAPAAYVIPQGWYEVLNRLSLNGIISRALINDSTITVTAYHIEGFKASATPYEKHHRNSSVLISKTTREARFLKGDRIINLNQPGNRYLVEMLEPNGDDAFFSWNFFDGILQQKEGYSDYRWEDLAAKVLKKDPALAEKLRIKKATDPKFAGNSSAILDFIYQNSPFLEQAYLNYQFTGSKNNNGSLINDQRRKTCSQRN